MSQTRGEGASRPSSHRSCGRLSRRPGLTPAAPLLRTCSRHASGWQHGHCRRRWSWDPLSAALSAGALPWWRGSPLGWCTWPWARSPAGPQGAGGRGRTLSGASSGGGPSSTFRGSRPAGWPLSRSARGGLATPFAAPAPALTRWPLCSAQVAALGSLAVARLCVGLRGEGQQLSRGVPTARGGTRGTAQVPSRPGRPAPAHARQPL